IGKSSIERRFALQQVARLWFERVPEKVGTRNTQGKRWLPPSSENGTKAPRVRRLGWRGCENLAGLPLRAGANRPLETGRLVRASGKSKQSSFSRATSFNS